MKPITANALSVGRLDYGGKFEVTHQQLSTNRLVRKRKRSTWDIAFGDRWRNGCVEIMELRNRRLAEDRNGWPEEHWVQLINWACAHEMVATLRLTIYM